MNPPPQRLYVPRPARVEVDATGVPSSVGAIPVDSVREEWLVEDRWWTLHPLRRHYFELVLTDGRDVVVFRSADGWFLQRA